MLIHCHSSWRNYLPITIQVVVPWPPWHAWFGWNYLCFDLWPGLGQTCILLYCKHFDFPPVLSCSKICVKIRKKPPAYIGLMDKIPSKQRQHNININLSRVNGLYYHHLKTEIRWLDSKSDLTGWSKVIVC